MYCIDCDHSKFLNNENGVVELCCVKKSNTVVFGFAKCSDSPKYKEEEKVIKIYLDNYKTMNICDIAYKIGWTPNKLNYFIEAKLLPRRKFYKNSVRS